MTLALERFHQRRARNPVEPEIRIRMCKASTKIHRLKPVLLFPRYGAGDGKVN